jgi:hypothetical protein
MAGDIDINEAYPPRWITKDNVDGLLGKFGYHVTIASLAYEMIGEPKQQKLVTRFREVPQALVTKRAHFDACSELYGPSSSAWIGQRIRVQKNPKYGSGAGETGLVVLPPRQPAATVRTHDDDAEDVPF